MSACLYSHPYKQVKARVVEFGRKIIKIIEDYTRKPCTYGQRTNTG